jgi:hypothetical protein
MMDNTRRDCTAVAAAADDGVHGHVGCTCAQIYTGTESAIIEGFAMATESEMPSTFMDFVWKHTVANALLNDNAKVVSSVGCC